MLIPERLPSLILLVGCWVPAAVAGRVAAEIVHRRATRIGSHARPALTYAVLAAFVVASTAAWFFINLRDMPPYVPGARAVPTYATPEATRWLAGFTTVIVLPLSALACWLAFRLGMRSLRQSSAALS